MRLRRLLPFTSGLQVWFNTAKPCQIQPRQRELTTFDLASRGTYWEVAVSGIIRFYSFLSLLPSLTYNGHQRVVVVVWQLATDVSFFQCHCCTCDGVRCVVFPNIKFQTGTPLNAADVMTRLLNSRNCVGMESVADVACTCKA